MGLQGIGHHSAVGYGQKAQVLLHSLGGLHPKGGMGPAQFDQSLVILKHRVVLVFAIPVNLVNPIGGSIGVVVSLFGAQKVHSPVEQGNSLGSQHHCPTHFVQVN